MSSSNDVELYDSYKLSLFDRLKASNELNETEEKTRECIKELKALLSEKNIANGLVISDSFLLQFIRHGKHDTKKVFLRLTKFINFWKKHKEFFVSIPREYYFKPSSKFFTILPKRSPDGCVILLVQLGKWDTTEITERQVQHIWHSSLLYSLQNPKTQINGFIAIGDVKNCSFQHVRRCTPSAVLFLCTLGLNCTPARYTEIHFVNNNLFLQIFWMLVRPLFPEKLRKRCYFHSSPNDLLNHLPAAVLPDEYGGELKDYYTEEWVLAANEHMTRIFEEA